MVPEVYSWTQGSSGFTSTAGGASEPPSIRVSRGSQPSAPSMSSTDTHFSAGTPGIVSRASLSIPRNGPPANSALASELLTT